MLFTLNQFLGFLALAVTVLSANYCLDIISARSKPDACGWRPVKPGVVHWTAIVLLLLMTAGSLYIWLFVGSTRYDAEKQMLILFCLIVAFALGTVLLVIETCFTSSKRVRWRDFSIKYESKSGTEQRHFRDITKMRRIWFGYVVLSFRDGTALQINQQATGATDLFINIDDYLTSHSNFKA